MLYLHDVWVNWFEGEENGYNVCYFHEWRKDDGIDILDQVPLLYVTSNLFDYIENDLDELPTELLDAIYKKSYVREGSARRVIEYSCVVTDGKGVLIIDTMNASTPIKKSRLIPRQEKLALGYIEHTEQYNYGFDEDNYKKEYHLLSLQPQYMFGLTRRERQIKQILAMALSEVKKSDSLAEMKYWLTELYPNEFETINKANKDEVWVRLMQGCINGWRDTHEDVCSRMIKGQSYLEALWREEVELAK